MSNHDHTTLRALVLTPHEVRLAGRGELYWIERPIDRRFSLVDGYHASAEWWNALDFRDARLDMGPSPAGNAGPYLHVPRLDNGVVESVHRVYPKVFRGDALFGQEVFAVKRWPGHPDNLSVGYAVRRDIMDPDFIVPTRLFSAARRHATPVADGVERKAGQMPRWASRIALTVRYVRPVLVWDRPRENRRGRYHWRIGVDVRLRASWHKAYDPAAAFDPHVPLLLPELAP